MSSQDLDSLSYKPGAIKFIKLYNFMCHTSFELPLGPNVNFIIGPNGSGKSALLTALTVALGARATTTARGKKASDFIKYGAKQARIIIVIHNYDKIMNKNQAFKPDEYGKTITVEKTLYREESAKLVLKNDKDKKVSERKQELDEMMEHFGIVVNNPICILNQEVSKTFLHSKKPEDKFDLFMKATDLEQIEQDYDSANMFFKEWNSSNNLKNVSFALLDKEYAACEEKLSFITKSAKLKDVLEDLNREYIFAMDRENEELKAKLEKQAQGIKKQLEDCEIHMNKRVDKIKKFEEEIQISRSKIQTINQSIEESKKKFREIQTKALDVKTKQFEVTNKIQHIKQKVSRNIDDKKSLEKSIEEKKKELKEQNDLDNDSEQRKIEIESLEREIPTYQGREKTLRADTAQLGESMTSVRSELQAANLRVSDLRNKQAQHQAVLRRLKNGQDNSLRKYGDHVIRIREEIDRAHSNGRFKHKPIGPLGYYIKLNSPDISEPLEIHLGKNAHAFACDNHQDMNTLQSIFKRLMTSNARDFRQPVIITRPFGSRHDVSKFKANHQTYKTLLDYLDIEEDAVFNALVDRCAPESVLFIPDYRQAEALMIDQNAIPKNTRMAYTKDCSTMYPRTDHGGYRSFANKGGKRYLFSDSNTNQIRETEREISMLNADLRDAENRSQTIQNSLTVQRNEYEKNILETKKLINEIRRKEEQLLNLRTIITVQPQELTALEAEHEAICNVISALELEIEKHSEILDSLNKDLADIQQEKDSCQALTRLHEKARQDELDIIEANNKNIQEAKLKIKDLTMQIEIRKRENGVVNASLEEHLIKLARNKLSIEDDWVRPDVLRKTGDVKAELNQVRTQIQVQEEENQDPDVVVNNLTKRMAEISSITAVKDKNLSNYGICERKLKNRQEGFASLRSNTIAAVSATFATVMRTMKMNGQLQIHLNDVTHQGQVIKKARTLEMRIDTNYMPPPPSQRVGTAMSDNNNESHIRDNNNTTTSRSQPTSRRSRAASQLVMEADLPPRTKRARRDQAPGNGSQLAEKENEIKMTDTRSLSGGERSFSTVAFVLALWHHCASPFKLMDEIDVFMDMVTRRISYNALIRFAQFSENPGQFIFFSPLELPKIDHSGNYVRVFEMPCIVRKRPLSQALVEVDVGGGDEL